MSEKGDLPLRAEDAVARLKRSRESSETADDRKRQKHGPVSPALGETGRAEPVVDSSSVLGDVAGLRRQDLGSVVYAPHKLLAKGHELQFNGVLRVKIGNAFLSETCEAVKRRAVWGTDVYTDDTDLVAALFHMGYLSKAVLERDIGNKDLLVEILLLPPLQRYTGSLRHSLISRSWIKHDGISYMVLGKPRPMTAGWAHAGKALLHARYEALRELRDYDSRDIAYV